MFNVFRLPALRTNRGKTRQSQICLPAAIVWIWARNAVQYVSGRIADRDAEAA